MAPKSLTILLTLSCPLECAHCITDSSPHKSGGLSVEVVRRITLAAKAAGIGTVGFTGGDPFAHLVQLRECLEYAKDLGLRIGVATSAFWASSEEKAERVLRTLPALDILGLSTDSYHQKFVPIENISNALRAARRLDIPKVEVQSVYLNKAEIASLRRVIAAENTGASFHAQKLWPVGRAARLLNQSPCEKDSLRPADQLDLRCPCMSAPVVTSTMKVVGCCSALLDLGDEHPFVLGDLEQQSLAEILSAADSNKYYNFVRVFGLKPLVDMVRAEDPALLDGAFTNACHVCYELHTREDIWRLLRPRLDASLSGSGVPKEVPRRFSTAECSAS